MEFAGTKTEAESFQGRQVFATSGDHVGDVEKVLYDKATGRPEWLAVRSGGLGLKSRIVPFHGVERRAEGVSVPYSASKIGSAPELEADEISQEQERTLASHYGLRYSESRSPTGLVQGQKRSSEARARSGRSVTSRRGKSQRSRSRPRTRRSDGPTRDDLYEQAKRLGIEGRSKMNKAQLQRAVGRRSGQRSSSAATGKANPFEVQKFLEAVGYPANKRELVREAKEQGADARIRSTLKRLPDAEFGTPAEVSKAISSLA